MRQQDLVADWLVERIAAMIETDPASVPWDAPFTDLGLPSVEAVELSDDLERWSGLTLPPTLAFDYPTIEAVAAYVAGEVEREGRTLPPPPTREELPG
jgi:acyl carrier protein